MVNLEKEKMDVVREIAATNMKVSEAKNALFRLKEDEQVYLSGRERRAIERIEKTLDESKELINEVKDNFSEVRLLCVSISELAGFLTEANGKFHDALGEFMQREELWNIEFDRQMNEVAEERKGIMLLRSVLSVEKKNNESTKAKITRDLALIESRQQQIRAALEVLKKKEKNG